MNHRLHISTTVISISIFLQHTFQVSQLVFVSWLQFRSVTQLCLTLCDHVNHSTPGLPVHHQLLELAQTHVHWVSDSHLTLCRPLLLLPSVLPSIRVFSNESVLRIRCPKYWNFSFSISPSNEYSALISFRMDWLDLLAVRGTLRVFSNTIVQKHQFFSAQLSLYSNSHIRTDYWKNHSFD